MEIVQGSSDGSGSGVSSINGLTGDVELAEGTNITITEVGQDIIISSAGGSSPSGGLNAIQVDNGSGGFNGDNAEATINPTTGAISVDGNQIYSDGFGTFTIGGRFISDNGGSIFSSGSGSLTIESQLLVGGSISSGTNAVAEIQNGGFYVANYGNGVVIPGGGVLGAYFNGPTGTSPFGFSAANGGSIGSGVPLWYYSWDAADGTSLGFRTFDPGGTFSRTVWAFDATTGIFSTANNTLDDGSGNAIFTGNVTASSFITNGGTSSQVVLGDGTLGTYSSGTTFIDNEAATRVSGTSFTLANTPIVGSVHVFGGGGRLTLGTDYSISGVTITILVGSYAAGQIIVDYRI